MKISESDIESIFNKIDEQQGNDEKMLTVFVNEQPHIAAWLLGEDFKVLTEEEQDYLFFLSMVIYEACKNKLSPLEEIDGELIREVEEANWEWLDQSTAKTFRERVTVFFEQSEEEDLLAFIEDSLMEDEDEQDTIVTKIGREPMFVALATVSDLFTDTNKGT